MSGLVSSALVFASGLGGLGGCEAQEARPRPASHTLRIDEVRPQVILPGTRLEVTGQGFLDELWGNTSLVLRPDGASALPRFLTVEFRDGQRLELAEDVDVRSRFEGDAFAGAAYVVVTSLQGAEEQFSNEKRLNLRFATELEPQLELDLTQGEIHINDALEVQGDGLLLGEEGRSLAIFTGCFHPGGSATCVSVDGVEVEIEPSDPFARDQGSFRFSPKVAGIQAGRFEGMIEIVNEMASGKRIEGDQYEVDYLVDSVEITSLGEGASLGEYLDIEGAGFIGGGGEGERSLTTLHLVGELRLDDNSVRPVDFELIPEFVTGRSLRYVVNEEDELVEYIDPRRQSGLFTGTVEPVLRFENETTRGEPLADVVFEIQPIHQVVYVNFLPAYTEALREFGLRAIDNEIRKRVFAVLRRDYASLAVEFREEKPEDFAWYTQIDIAGPDVNGGGLFGLDNTPGKDVDNQRLYDRIGGVNAITEQQNYDGYGGVFIQSFLYELSTHPPDDDPGELAEGLFDQIFDPFRPDLDGLPVSGADFVSDVSMPADGGATCPAQNRSQQIGCAIYVLGNLIGNTAGHELGHSLGLANPYGSPTDFHNFGDVPGAMMDSGGNRPFNERAELQNTQPARFCTSHYEYLWSILPGETKDTSPRPPC